MTAEVQNASSDLLETAKIIIYLGACALNRQKPDRSRLLSVDFYQLYKESRRQMISALIGLTLKKAGVINENFMSGDLVARWNQDISLNYMQNIRMDAERNKLISFMEVNQIWYMPLKGIILKDYYPEFGMREMSDNDILYDSSGSALIKKYMKSNGYSEQGKGHSYHDVFIKQPCYCFEMHHELINHGHRQIFVDYYRDPEKFLLKDSGNRYGYHFSDEEFYTFFVVHACKHLEARGIGFRTLFDWYMYLRKKYKVLDWNQINQKMELLGLCDFERDGRNLSRKLLACTENAEELTASERELLNTMVISGVYGTLEQYYKNKLKKIQNSGGKMDLKASKRKYILNRLFGTSDIYNNDPVLKKYPVLIPFWVIKRIFLALTVRRKEVLTEIRQIHDIK